MFDRPAGGASTTEHATAIRAGRPGKEDWYRTASMDLHLASIRVKPLHVNKAVKTIETTTAPTFKQAAATLGAKLRKTSNGGSAGNRQS